MAVEDIFTLQEIESATISPDGEWVAVVVRRPQSSSEVYARFYVAEGSQADVWLVSRRTGERRQLTNGVTDASGYWLPQWSPNGRRLAMVSTKPEGNEPRGGDNVRLYVWDEASGALTRRTTNGVDLWGRIDAPGVHRSPRFGSAFAWLSDTTILVQLLPAGQAPSVLTLLTRIPRLAQDGWAKAERGTEPTASILESRGPPALPVPTGPLTVVDIVHGTSRTVADVPIYEDANREAVVSPDSRRVALLTPIGSVRPTPDRLLSFYNIRARRVGVASLSGSTAVHWMVDSTPGGVFSGLLGWSPTGTELALRGGTADPDPSYAEAIVILSTTTGAVRRLAPPGLTVSAMVWSANGAPIVYAVPDTSDSASAQRTRGRSDVTAGRRADWWRLDAGVPPRNLTATMRDVPSSLVSTTDPNRFVGAAGGALWAIDVVRGQPVQLTDTSSIHVSRIAWPDGRDHIRVAEFIVEGGDTERRGAPQPLYHARLTRDRALTRVLTRPSPGAQFEDYSPAAGGSLLFDEAGPTGTFLWASAESGSAVQLLALNEQLAGITPGRQMLLSYRGADGDSLQADALLPPDYRAGTRYPVVVWVYPGHIVSDTSEILASTNFVHGLNLQPLAAHGYVVLFPSMPLPPNRVKSDPYAEIPKGVLPAVDRLVELGIADPTRVGVMGQSYGGYGTYVLVTSTTRFKAAVTMAGLSDLVSLYGQFSLRNRYLAASHEDLFQEINAETGQLRMVGPPWSDMWHYMRNSPIFFLDRVKTPLMIVQGDMDYEGITQGEEFFTGLYRLGKRAKFVRYWGEEHVIGSPANIRHLWSQIFAWFDEYLRADGQRTPTTALAPAPAASH